MLLKESTIKGHVLKPLRIMSGLKENTNICLMLEEPYYTKPNSLKHIGLMPFFM